MDGSYIQFFEEIGLTMQVVKVRPINEIHCSLC